MCGICGFSGHENNNVLIDMGNAIRHRGPDEEGSYADGRMNLCSRRLSIVDIENGKQPMENQVKTVCLVWNGELYNDRELRRELVTKGHTFQTDHSDTEVILHMYEEYGISFVDRLNGMFAIAIWDKREETLYLIRDRVGVKPLFYYFDGNDIIFASEIKSILKHPAYNKKLNYESLYQFFSFKNTCAPDTAFAGVHSVMPGTMLVFKNHSLEEKTYWKVDFSKQSTDSLEDAIENVRELLKDAVKIRLNADVEIGTFLSGGLDSSFVSAIAAKEYGAQMKSFCLGHEVQKEVIFHKGEDVKCAREMADLIGTNHILHQMNAREAVDELDEVIRAFDQPFTGSMSTYFLSKVMSKHVKTAISGDGADELFGSYLPHMVSFPLEYMRRMIESGKTDADFELEKLRPMEGQQEYLKSLFQVTQGNEVLKQYVTLVMGDEQKPLFLKDELFGTMAKEHATLHLIQKRYQMLTGKDVLNRALEYDMGGLLPNQVLSFSDALSMSNSLEIRTPFLDYRLVEYVASLPGTYKIRNGKTKYLLKEAAKGILPDHIINRPKEGFVMPVHDWLKAELKEYALDTLSVDSISKYHMLKPESVYFVLKKYYDAPLNNSSLEPIIWNFIVFQKWCELYV